MVLHTLFKSKSGVSMNLEGKVVLIVNYNNSESGIRLRDELLLAGCKVCVTCDKVVNSNEDTLIDSPKFRAYELNTANYDEVLQLRSSIEIAMGSVDILIILAPSMPELNIFRALNSDLPQMIEDTLKSYFWAVKCFVDGMISQHGGQIVGVVPMYDKSDASNMLRRAIMGFLKSLHSEMNVFNRSYISVTSVHDHHPRENNSNALQIKAIKVMKGICEKARVVEVIRDASEKKSSCDLRRLFFNLLALIWMITSAVKILFAELIWSPKRKDIRNQVVLITGGGMGLGREIALGLTKTGCKIAIADINFESAQSTVSSLNALKIEAKAYKADISNERDVIQLKTDIQKDLGDVDILVNNAALIPVGGILQAKVETIAKTLQVNLMSHMLIAKVFLPDMLASMRGHIVTISSIAGFFSMPGALVYCTTKFGVTGFVDSLEYELKKSKQDLIKTTTIHPYFIKTRKDLVEVLNTQGKSVALIWLKPSNVAKKVVEAILENKRRVIIPNLKWLLLLQTLISPTLDDYLTKKLFKVVADLEPEGNVLT